MIERDPEVIPYVDIASRVSRICFLDDKLPRHESGQGYVRVVEQLVRWNETEASKVLTYQGLTTCTDVDTSWTIMNNTYHHVKHKKGVIEQGMEKFIWEEVDHQEQLEAVGYLSPTWRVLHALQSLRGYLSFSRLVGTHGTGFARPAVIARVAWVAQTLCNIDTACCGITVLGARHAGGL